MGDTKTPGCCHPRRSHKNSSYMLHCACLCTVYSIFVLFSGHINDNTVIRSTQALCWAANKWSIWSYDVSRVQLSKRHYKLHIMRCC